MDLIFEPNEIICREGEVSSDMYFIKEGHLLVCVVQGTQVKALGRIEAGEFIGELSFFDQQPRASTIVALEKSVLIQISREDVIEHLPFWFIEVGKNLTKKIRDMDKIVQTSNFKKIGSEDQKPLTMDEQRVILANINKQ